MTQAEMVTDFVLGEPEKPGKKISEIIKGLRDHLKANGFADEESMGVSPSIQYGAPDTRLPELFSYLIAFAIEGNSEGWYVHVGCILRPDPKQLLTDPAGITTPYMDFGFAKVWTPEVAYAMAREAQRFLTAARWN